MINQTEKLSPVLYIPHGAGPLPLLGDKGHHDMVSFLQACVPTLGTPSAIIVISAHWEENVVTINNGQTPPLLYDYYGFPKQAYDIKYPVSGNAILAEKIYHLLGENGIEARLESNRGFDHGVFVPLKIMFPEATIPCVQVSLLNKLDTTAHINIGKTLRALRTENILFMGSGFSFHNMQGFFSQDEEVNSKNDAFQQWLVDTCTNTEISAEERETKLVNWQNAPHAIYCHPREEHLLPLHVCSGLSNSNAKLVFDNNVAGKRACAFLWAN